MGRFNFRVGLNLIICFVIQILLSQTICSQPTDHVQEKQASIIFIHGISAGFQDWARQADAISSENLTIRFKDKETITHDVLPEKNPERWVWNISYYTMDPIEESLRGNLTRYAYRVETLLEKITELTGHDRFVIVAHSMGGLIARRMMTLSQKNWDSVVKILTVGTPHNGVETSFGIVGQLKDLNPKSTFLRDLNREWKRFPDASQKWGVVGAMDISPYKKKKSFRYVTDSGGFGFVTISSAIPFGEWEGAVQEMNEIRRDSPHFAFRLATYGTHRGLLFHPATQLGIEWILR